MARRSPGGSRASWSRSAGSPWSRSNSRSPGTSNCESTGAEIELDPEAPDPPDLLEGDTIDLAGYLVEHLSLAIDPFPRKAGAVFDYDPKTEDLSPFAVLKGLKDKEA
jgi:uncharacterized metal-binding protein YceD (DUF177 family)